RTHLTARTRERKMSAEINEATTPTACDRPQVPWARRTEERRRPAAQARRSRVARQEAVAVAAPSGPRHAAGRSGRAEPAPHAGVPEGGRRVPGRKRALRVPRRPLLGAGEP